jgi:hypothetical protein
MTRSQWIAGGVGLLLAVALPVIGPLARKAPADRCALDGVAIEPRYRVRVRDGGRDSEFCCVHCAELWLGRQAPASRAVFVMDEAGGREIDATSAWFVRSAVVTTPTTGNRIHAFATRADAERHAESARGRLLTGAERPFAGPD